MTEADWLSATEPTPMLEFLRGKASDRKLRLFACACCRRIWHLLGDERLRAAVATAEEFADGTRDAVALNRAIVEVNAVWLSAYGGLTDAEKRMVGARSPSAAATAASASAAVCSAVLQDARLATPAYYRAATAVTGTWRSNTRDPGELQAQAHLLRDIFGNPFRPAAVDPSSLTTNVRLLAQGIYDEKAFDRMPILADALQDAGCNADDILNHLRDPHAAHVRGCWALDLILGKQ